MAEHCTTACSSNSNNKDTTQHPPLNKLDLCCQECHHAAALYQCPRCDRRTCSLNCCRAHKTRLHCNGRRDKTRFVPVSRMNDATLQSDYLFLEDIVGTVAAGQRLRRQVGASSSDAGTLAGQKRSRGLSHNYNNEPPSSFSTEEHALLRAAASWSPSKRHLAVLSPSQPHSAPVHNPQGVPPKMRTFQRLAAERSTSVLFMPAGMARHQSNQSQVRKGDVLHWTVEWSLHAPQQQSQPSISTRTGTAAPTSFATTTTLTCETSRVGDVLQTLLSGQPKEESDSLVVLLKKLPCPAHQPLYIEISTSSTIREALQYATVYEYPTFHLVPHGLVSQFPRMITSVVEDEEEEVVVAETTLPQADVDNAVME